MAFGKPSLVVSISDRNVCANRIVKINLDPGEWNDPADRAAFLNDIDPEICTGDPISFMAMAELDTNIKPKALVSSAMKLLPETRRTLEERFGCPVVDIFSLCEPGPIAYWSGDEFAVLPDDIFVEVLDHTGRRCEPGELGEITITGGRNPYLPLLRYRTGDWAAMDWVDGHPVLRQLEGREPVTFQRADDSRINCIDVATVLRPFPVLQFSLHQNADRSLVLRLRGGTAATDDIRETIEELFGSEIEIAIEQISDDVWKVAPYSTDIR